MSNEQLLYSFTSANRWLGHNTMRAYQHELLTAGGIEWDGKQYNARAFSYSPHFSKFIIVLYEGKEIKHFLFTAGMGSGFEIKWCLGQDRIILEFSTKEGSHTLIPTSDNFWSFMNRYNLDETSISSLTVNASSLPKAVILGHQNFAHFIWNQLGTLLEFESELLSLLRSNKIRFIIRKSDLSTIESLGGLALSKVLSKAIIHDQLPSEYIELYPIGGRSVTEQARQSVRTALFNDTRLKLEHFSYSLQISSPVLWLGVRGAAGDPENLVQFYAQLAELWQLNFNGTVILDGFTPPSKNFEKRKSNRVQRQRTSTICIKEILKICRKNKASNIRTTEGMLLKSAIYLAGKASFYVAPRGTIQHKIGWVYDTNGIIINPPFRGRNVHAKWPAKQRDASPDIRVIPLDHLEAIENTTVSTTKRDMPYKISDCFKTSEYIIDLAKEYIEPINCMN